MRLQSITILLVVLMSMMGIRANAQGFEVANAEGVTVRYSITLYDREQEQFGAVVIYNLPDNWNYYKGNLVIPEHIAYSSEDFPPQFGNNFPVVGIEGGAFYRCNYLTSVVIPNSVTYIGGSAFEGCESLNTITIPENVTDIGQRAFYDCRALKKVRVRMTTPATIDENTFPNRGSQTLYVPVGCKGVYEAADYWKEFASIVEKPVGTHIEFADDNVEALCLANWDTNGDGGLSYEEAAAVTDLGEVFQENDRIWSFNELQYFTGLNTISDGAFNDCSGLLSVIIPNSVRSIGQGAFLECRSLTSITIPESVLSIGSAAFAFSNLKWVTARMAKPVAIDDFVFYNTPYANATLYVPAGSKVAYEAANCWKEFNEIVEMPLAGNIKFADADVEALCVSNWDSDHDGELSYAEAVAVTDLEGVFRENRSITSFNELQYFTGLKYIKDYQFEFSSLRSVVIPNSVVAILGNAFIGCGLTSVTIPEKVTEIGQHAFEGCRNLASVIVKSATPATIYSSTFPLGEQQLILYVPVGCVPAYEAAEYWKYFGTIAEITDEVTTKDGMMSTLVDLLAYLDKLYNKLKEKATKDEAPDLYNKFMELEYAYGEMMDRVDDATTMEELNEVQGMIDYYTPKFSKLESEIDDFKKPEIPGVNIEFADANVKTICIANWDTNGDGKLSYEEAAAVTDLGEVFKYNDEISSFNELQYFTGLTSIEAKAFSGCSGLTSVTIPNSVTSIEYGAFGDCRSLTSITIPADVNSIGNGAFWGCSGLTSIVVESGNTAYDSRNNCNAIICTSNNALIVGCKNTVIPSSVTSIGVCAFEGFSDLTSVTIPNSVTSIGGCAFRFCSSLTSVSIPNSVTTIDYGAFEGSSSLTSVSIPNSVTYIGSAAFYNCSALTEVFSYLDEPFGITDDVFLYQGWPNTFTSATLHVPAGTKALYEVTDGWKNFKNIVEMEDLKPLDEDENVDFSDADIEINEETDLTGTVVNNMYYNIGTDAGGYNADDKCIVITKETSDEQMAALEGLGITDMELKQNFTGIIFKVPAGSGNVAVTAETSGNMTLKVKVGNSLPMEMELSGRLKMKVPYDVTEDTYVYIFAGTQDAARGLKRTNGEQNLKIYGVELETTVVKGDANGDKKVNDADVAEVANHLVGKTSANFMTEGADINSDGVVNIVDQVLIIKRSLRKK